MTKKQKLKIELVHWDYTCGDGCCYDYGVRLKLNGEELEQGLLEALKLIN